MKFDNFRIFINFAEILWKGGMNVLPLMKSDKEMGILAIDIRTRDLSQENIFQGNGNECRDYQPLKGKATLG